MATVKAKIAGVAPLLMNRFAMEKTDESKAKRRDEQYDPVTDALKALYKDDGLGCYVPSTWVEACLRETAKEFKAARGRGTLKATVLSSVFVDPEKIPLGKDTYDELDVRPVVIQRNRVVKGRPRFNAWECEFTINFNEDRMKKDVLKQLLEEAGATKGIGDYRPKFGRFKVVSFE